MMGANPREYLEAFYAFVLLAGLAYFTTAFVWGTQPFLRRCLHYTVGLGLLIACLLWDDDFRFDLDHPAWRAPFLMLCSQPALWMLRYLAGWRLVRSDETVPRDKWTIRHLLLASVVVSAAAALASVGTENIPPEAIMMRCGALLLAMPVTLLPSVWYILRLRSGWPVAVIHTVIVMSIVLTSIRVTSGAWPRPQMILETVIATLIWLGGPWLGVGYFRLRGRRLIWGREVCLPEHLSGRRMETVQPAAEETASSTDDRESLLRRSSVT